jgi:hypothetical protein
LLPGVKLFASSGLAHYSRTFLSFLTSPGGNNIPSPRSEAFSTIWMSMLSLPEKRLGLPNRETATAQTFTNHPYKRSTNRRKPSHLWLGHSPATTPPFSEAEKQRPRRETVLPYMGSVKTLSLYIVAQAINRWDAGLAPNFSTKLARSFFMNNLSMRRFFRRRR